MSNLKQFGLALNMYAQNYNEGFPQTKADGYCVSPDIVPANVATDGLEGMELLYAGNYISDPNLYACPTGKPRQEPTDPVNGIPTAGCTDQNTSYGYDPRHRTTHPAGTAVMADKADAAGTTNNSTNHDAGGQNVLYIDGHVTWWTGTDVGFERNEIFDATDDGAATEGASHIMQ